MTRGPFIINRRLSDKAGTIQKRKENERNERFSTPSPIWCVCNLSPDCVTMDVWDFVELVREWKKRQKCDQFSIHKRYDICKREFA